MANLLTLVAAFIPAALLYRFRARITGALKRFDARNRARRLEEITERFDRNAHYRHTVQLAEEQFETVQTVSRSDERTGTPVERYVFLGVEYATPAEAEAARHAAVIASARSFYLDLDRTMLGRRRRDPTVATGDDRQSRRFNPWDLTRARPSAGAAGRRHRRRRGA